MHCLSLSFPGFSWRDHVTELRIDVKQQPSDIGKELDALYGRLNCPGDALHGLPVACLRFHNLVLRYREADGEHYVYVEDTVRRCLAGYVVFNRLVEVDRRADACLRAPHTKFAPAYQRRGIATAIYRWWLEAGNCLISGARQSAGANALWCSLGRRYQSFYVDLRDKKLRHLGLWVDSRTRQDLHTRMIMLGKGWDDERLSEHAGMLMETAVPAEPSLRKRLLSGESRHWC